MKFIMQVNVEKRYFMLEIWKLSRREIRGCFPSPYYNKSDIEALTLTTSNLHAFRL